MPSTVENDELSLSIEKMKAEINRKKKKKKKTIKIIVAVFLVIILSFAAVITAAWFRGRSAAKSEVSIDENAVVIEKGPAPVIRNSGKTITYKGTTYTFNSNIVTFAFIGIDKNSMGLKNGIVGTGGQSDTIAVLAYDLSDGSSKVIVIPRETMADIDTFDTKGGYVDIKKAQICLAYAYGDGAKSSCEKTINSISRLLFGMKINHYVTLDVDGIPALNDAVGGVNVTCLETIGQFTKGEKITLYGNDAVSYVRNRRKDTVDADSARRERQKQYIKAFVSKALKKVRKDFTVVPRLWSTASDYMITDMTLNDATYLASVALSRNFTFGSFSTVPGSYTMGETYAEYYADNDALFELVLDTFYTK